MDEGKAGGLPIKREKSAAELRKSNKPLMEKRRRERINNCLDQLKSILMEVTKKESSYYSKLEKADILEMTVKYLKNLKRQQLAVAMSNDPSVLGKYMAGFNECTSEVTKYLTTVDGLSSDIRSRMMNHLAGCLQRTSNILTSPPSNQGLQLNTNPSFTQSLGLQLPSATPLSTLPGSQGMCVVSPPNPGIQTIPASPMQLVPAKLPSGDLVFLLTNPQVVSNAGLQDAASASSSGGGFTVEPQQVTQVTGLQQASSPGTSISAPCATVTTRSPSQSSNPGSSSAAASATITEVNNNTIVTPHIPVSTIKTERVDDNSSEEDNDENREMDPDSEDDEAEDLPMWRPW